MFAKKVRAGLSLVLLIVALSGCQTMAGWFGLATEQYVEEKMTEVQTQFDGQLVEMKSQVDEYAATADKLEELIGSVETAVQTTEELKQLAVVLEDRLTNLPEETIKQLVEILQAHLEGR